MACCRSAPCEMLNVKWKVEMRNAQCEMLNVKRSMLNRMLNVKCSVGYVEMLHAKYTNFIKKALFLFCIEKMQILLLTNLIQFFSFCFLRFHSLFFAVFYLMTEKSCLKK